MKEFLERLRARAAEKRKKSVVRRASELYQVQEYQGSLWFTYMGSLICQTEMLSGLPIKSLEKMREAYIERELNDDK